MDGTNTRHHFAPKEASDLDPKFRKYTAFLLEDESVKEAFEVGVLWFKIYVLLFTDKRMILIKKIPKNVVEMDYEDIELVEYYTNIEWLKMFYGLLIYILLYEVFINISILLEKVIVFIPPLESILYSGNFLGMNLGTFLPSAVLFVAGTYFMGIFVLSVIGRLRILVHDQPPMDIATFFNQDVTGILHIFSELSEFHRQSEKNRELRALASGQKLQKPFPDKASNIAPSNITEKPK